jgi:hypothetical protein
LSVSLPWLHPLDWTLLLVVCFFIYSIDDITGLVGGYWVYLWFCLRSLWLYEFCLSLSFFLVYTSIYKIPIFKITQWKMNDSVWGFQVKSSKKSLGIIGECFEECGVNNVSDNLWFI